ncbi:MAG: hypothetical protein LC667_09115, partial [Thioalkalivibrio sp.]|nr:hypothetical protein [Thioalkalivibrio sp.]
MPEALVVRVTDSRNNPVANVEVRWAVVAGGGLVSPASSFTDRSGAARAVWTLGAGENEVSATAADLSVAFVALGTEPQLLACLDAPPANEPGCPITVEPHMQVQPRISGNRVVWEDYRFGLPAVFMLDLVTHRTTQVTPPGTENILPAIEGDRVVYVRSFACPAPWEVYVYDVPSGVATLFHTIDCNVGLSGFSMSGDRVVWHERRDENWDVYTYDFVTETEARVTTDDAEQGGPSIYGDTIVWSDRRHGKPWGDLYTYDLRTGVEQRITDATTLGRGPIVTADKIVWGDTRGGYFALYEYGLERGIDAQVPSTPLLECSLAASQSGRYAAWADRGDGNYGGCDDVFLYDFHASSVLQLTSDPETQWYPALTDDYVVWEDHRDGQGRVY